MLKSMTGYGRIVRLVDNNEITIELKSVNHRYFDFSARVPRIYGFLEERLKRYINESISRGKIDCFVAINSQAAENEEIALNEVVLKGYLDALKKISDEYGVQDDISVSTLTRFSDIFDVKKNEQDSETIWSQVRDVMDDVIEEFNGMRKCEGEKLYIDVTNNLTSISNIVTKVEELAVGVTKGLFDKTKARIEQLLGEVALDEHRLINEIAVLSDKYAVDEEITRLKSHIEQLDKMLLSQTPTGKKVDFLIQELNREVNTIGSKCNDINISMYVVEAKSLIEKIREQIQNIE